MPDEKMLLFNAKNGFCISAAVIEAGRPDIEAEKNKCQDLGCLVKRNNGGRYQ